VWCVWCVCVVCGVWCGCGVCVCVCGVVYVCVVWCMCVCIHYMCDKLYIILDLRFKRTYSLVRKYENFRGICRQYLQSRKALYPNMDVADSIQTSVPLCQWKSYCKACQLLWLKIVFLTLRGHCTASWKVAGSIPDDVTGIFQWLNFPAALYLWSWLSV